MRIEPAHSALLDKVQDEGRRILRYWRDHVILSDGSFHGEIAHDGTAQADADRGGVLAARLLWTYARAVTSGFDHSVDCRQTADNSYEFFREHFWDAENLGFYWLIDKDHRPVVDRKHVYAQAFAIYALAEYYAVSSKEECLRMAQLTYTLLERYAADRQHHGYFESFTNLWEPAAELRLSPQDMDGAKSMNTHLHILEAYTRLYQVWPNFQLRERIKHLLNVMDRYILNHDTQHFMLFFDADWTPKSDVISYGHDIEGSWLMFEAAATIRDPGRMKRFAAIAVEMVDAVLTQGLDSDFGLMNEGRGLAIIDSDKHWWPQAEAVVGCVNAYQISGKQQYLDTALNIWGFITAHVRDREHGEWFWKVSKAGLPDTAKPIVEPWKCPYHNTRACIEVWMRLSREGETKIS